MPRNQTALGHNSQTIVSDDDIAALTLYYDIKTRSQQSEVAEAEAVLKSKRTALNGTFKLIKKDLQVDRKDWEADQKLQDMAPAAFQRHEGERRRRLEFRGLPVGTQGELNLSTGDTADDVARALADGYRAGRLAFDREPPEWVSPVLHPDWLSGYDKGQVENAMKLGRAAEIIAQREVATNADLGPLHDIDDEDDDDDDDLDVEAEARRLQAEGFMEMDGDDEFAPKVADVFPGEDSEAIDRKNERRAARQATH